MPCPHDGCAALKTNVPLSWGRSRATPPKAAAAASTPPKPAAKPAITPARKAAESPDPAAKDQAQARAGAVAGAGQGRQVVSSTWINRQNAALQELEGALQQQQGGGRAAAAVPVAAAVPAAASPPPALSAEGSDGGDGALGATMPSAGLGRAKLLTLKQQQKDAELEANRQAVIKVREVRGLAPGRRVELGNRQNLAVTTRVCAGRGGQQGTGQRQGQGYTHWFCFVCVHKGIGQSRYRSNRGHSPSASQPWPKGC